eukprot:scaffold54130_cov37-Prasinocladus_malaysianus.AAC.1
MCVGFALLHAWQATVDMTYVFSTAFSSNKGHKLCLGKSFHAIRHRTVVAKTQQRVDEVIHWPHISLHSSQHDLFKVGIRHRQAWPLATFQCRGDEK